MPNSSQPLVTGTAEGGVLVAAINVKEIRDTELSAALRDEIVALLKSTGARDVVLDCRRLEFIGSVGFLAFLGVRRNLDGGRIVLAALNPHLRKLFEICRLISPDPAKTAPFEAADTLEAAATKLQASTSH